MKRNRIICFALVVAMILSSNIIAVSSHAEANDEDTVYAADTDTVDKLICSATIDDTFADDCVIVAIDKANSAVNKVFEKEKFEGVSLEYVEDLTALPGDLDDIKNLDVGNYQQVLKLKLVEEGKEEVLEAIRELEKLDFVYAAFPNYCFAPVDPVEDAYGILSAEASVAAIDADDPSHGLSTRYGMINLSSAWDITMGDTSPIENRVRVGVMDSGLIEHPALEGNVYWDIAKDFYNEQVGKEAVIDDYKDKTGKLVGHGTAVSGIIGGKSLGSYLGGLCQNVAIVPLQTVISDNDDEFFGYNDFTAISKAFTYATANNIDILNCSFGKPADDPTPEDDLTVVDEIMAYKIAMQNYPGLIVCSAANNSVNSDQITIVPAGVDLDNIISVGNTQTDYSLYETSNYGVASVDIAAPGHDTYTTSSTGTYEWFQGTSAAAPYVAGTAALILSICPDMCTEQLKEIILDTASTESALIGKVANGAFLDAGAAVEKAANMVKVTFNDNNGNTKVVYYEKGTTYGELPNPSTRTGCDFAGWYDGSTKITNSSVVTSGDKTFSANWDATITYNTNGGDPINTQTVRFTDEYRFTPQPAQNRDGCDFYGWKSSVTGNTYTDEITIDRDTTLSAVWEATVTYDTNGGSTIEPQTYQFEDHISVTPSKATTRSRCMLYGWEYNGKVYTGDIVIDSDALFDARWEATVAVNSDVGYREYVEKVIFGDNYSFTLDDVFTKAGYKQSGWKYNNNIYKMGTVLSGLEGAINVTAQWEEIFVVISYEVPFYGDFHTSEYLYSSYVSNNGIPSSFLWDNHDGYDLISWQDKDSLTIYVPNSADKLVDFKNYSLIGITAPWPKGSVTYDANGGEGGPQPQTVYYKYYTIITDATPTRDGYTFLGWALSPDGDVAYVPGSKYSTYNDHILYAKWVSDSFVVRFDTGTSAADESPAYDPPLSVVYDTDDSYITLPNEIPVREGRVFCCWSYTCGETTTKHYPGEDFVLDASDFEGFDSDGDNVVELTAVWQEPRTEYAMAFVDLREYDGVTNKKYVRVVEAGKTYGECYISGDEEKVDAFPADPVAYGYIFDGWADAEGNIITADTVVEKDGFHYIYARWIPEADFNDVSDTDYFADAVSMTSWYGYMGGMGNGIFSPNASATRGMASVVLYRLEGSPVHGNNAFYDVDTYNADGTYNELSMAITWASENGIASAVSTNKFGTTSSITREQVATMLYRYAQYKGADMTVGLDDTALSPYADASTISSWATDAVKWAVSLGIMSGTSGTTLAPQEGVTRAQLAVFIMRVRNLLIDRDVITVLECGAINAGTDTIGYIEPTLGANSWAQINAASEAGIADVIWNVGDTKAVTLSTGEVITMQIYGFDHDYLTDGGKAGITFGLAEVMNNVRKMNETAEDGISFSDTFLSDLLNGTIYDSLPADLRSYMKSVEKTTSVGDGTIQVNGKQFLLYRAFIG